MCSRNDPQMFDRLSFKQRMAMWRLLLRDEPVEMVLRAAGLAFFAMLPVWAVLVLLYAYK